MKKAITILWALLMLCSVVAPAHSQTAKDELKAKFEAREPALRELKQQGRIGETIEGYVDVVDGNATTDAKVVALVNDENADRRRLYQILADEINAENPQAKVKATVEIVAARNARRALERADPNEFFRVAKDHWIRVKDFSRFEELTKLKTQGKVGETADGLVEIVKGEDRADAAINRVVNSENAARTAEYKALAENERVDVSVIAKRMAKRNFDNARVGDMLKDEGGSWRKK